MSNVPMYTGNQVGAAAQGASAAPSLEALLSQLGDTHRRVLTQAQVLGKVAGDWLASAVMGPGYIIPENEASLILAEATHPSNPIQAALQADMQDPNYLNMLEYAIALFACKCVTNRIWLTTSIGRWSRTLQGLTLQVCRAANWKRSPSPFS